MSNNKIVTIEYRVLMEDGQEVDATTPDDPFTFTLGEGTLFPMLEEVIAKMQIGEQKDITLTPDDAYGPIRDDGFKEVETSMLPEGYRAEGAILGFQAEDGQQHQVRVHEVKGEKSTLDFNHPLAGQTITCQIKLLKSEA